MFYCNDCAKKYGYPESMVRSYGPCEMCGKTKECNDVPCSALPDTPEDLRVLERYFKKVDGKWVMKSKEERDTKSKYVDKEKLLAWLRKARWHRGDPILSNCIDAVESGEFDAEM